MAASEPAALAVNGWRIYAHPLFLDQIASLEKAVVRLAARPTVRLGEQREAKILAAILKIAFEIIPADPAHAMFRQGNTLGAAHRHWCRAKFFAGRYRLFFQFSSARKVIVLAWVNDEETLRTYGKKTDAYAVFGAMLQRGKPPTDWRTLLEESLLYTKKPLAS